MGPAAISEQISRVLRSRTFANKSQLRKLLEVLHKNMDSQATLTTEQVIQELWPTEIKTKHAKDVATEMNRLRHALESYYDTEGKTDPVTIILPNRSVTAGNGRQEKCWIVAQPGEDEGVRPTVEREADPQPAGAKSKPQTSPRASPKTFGAISAVCATLGIVGYLSFRVLALPDQPKLGRLEGSALVIMNAEGKELWRKIFPEGLGPDWYYAPGLSSPSRMWFADLEGNGHTSVLFSYSPASGQQPHTSTLICYSDRGKEKWRWTPGRELAELNGSPPTYKILALAALKATEGKPPRVVVLSEHDPWWPSQVALLDSNGKTLSEYWHSGGLRYMVLADLDGDGREEIVASGASEYDHQATLVVLDPERVFGASKEAQPEFQIHGMGVSGERLRLLLPRSDLNRAMFQFNMATDPSVEHGVLRFTVLECIAPAGCRIWYEFDKNFHLISAFAGGDEFRSAHNKFYQTGKYAHTLSAEEQAAFQKVRCLVGCKSEFVPVGNLVP